MIAKILKGIGLVGLGISVIWLTEWYFIENFDISITGATAYFPFSQIVLISVLSHIATIGANRSPTLP